MKIIDTATTPSTIRISDFSDFRPPLQPFHLTPAKLPKHIEEYGKRRESAAVGQSEPGN
jgi:hypothetical protein